MSPISTFKLTCSLTTFTACAAGLHDLCLAGCSVNYTSVNYTSVTSDLLTSVSTFLITRLLDAR